MHNYLLGGYGNDTIYGGDAGDVIWGDYHPTGWPSRQTAVIHAGNGKNFIYANDTVNYVWTGTNPQTVVHAHEGSGVIHCENPHIVVFTSHHALPHYRLRRLPAHQLLLGRLLSGAPLSSRARSACERPRRRARRHALSAAATGRQRLGGSCRARRSVIWAPRPAAHAPRRALAAASSASARARAAVARAAIGQDARRDRQQRPPASPKRA